MSDCHEHLATSSYSFQGKFIWPKLVFRLVAVFINTSLFFFLFLYLSLFLFFLPNWLFLFRWKTQVEFPIGFFHKLTKYKRKPLNDSNPIAIKTKHEIKLVFNGKKERKKKEWNPQLTTHSIHSFHNSNRKIAERIVK